MATTAPAAGEPDHRRVVAVVEPDEQLAGGSRGPVPTQAGDDRLQLAGRDLAGAAAAVGVLGQPDGAARVVVDACRCYVARCGQRPALRA